MVNYTTWRHWPVNSFPSQNRSHSPHVRLGCLDVNALAPVLIDTCALSANRAPLRRPRAFPELSPWREVNASHSLIPRCLSALEPSWIITGSFASCVQVLDLGSSLATSRTEARPVHPGWLHEHFGPAPFALFRLFHAPILQRINSVTPLFPSEATA